jgi:hypothetical protein
MGIHSLKKRQHHRDTRLITGTAFDSDEIPFSFDSYDDLHGDEHENTGLRAGALGGGDEFSTGVVGICPWSAAREGCEIEEGCVDP